MSIQQVLNSDSDAVLEFLYNSPSSIGSGSGFTVPSVPFGVATLKRQVIVAIETATTGGGSTHTGVTIGGVTAVNIGGVQGTNCTVTLWQAEVPAGTSGSVVFSVSGAAAARAYIGVWSLKNLKSTVALSANQSPGGGDAPRSLTLTVKRGGISIAAVCTGGAGLLTGVNQNYDVASDTRGGSIKNAVDNAAFLVSDTARAITGASWR